MPVESPRSEEPSQECELCIQRKKESLLVEAVVDEAGTSYLRSTEVPPKLFLTLHSLAMTPAGRKKNQQKNPKTLLLLVTVAFCNAAWHFYQPLYRRTPANYNYIRLVCSPPPHLQRFFAVQKIIVNVITRCKRCIPRAGEKWNNSGAKNGGKKWLVEN